MRSSSRQVHGDGNVHTIKSNNKHISKTVDEFPTEGGKCVDRPLHRLPSFYIIKKIRQILKKEREHTQTWTSNLTRVAKARSGACISNLWTNCLSPSTRSKTWRAE